MHSAPPIIFADMDGVLATSSKASAIGGSVRVSVPATVGGVV